MPSDDKKTPGRGANGWTKVAARPERWEHREFGVVVERDADLWSFLPLCGHDYFVAFSLGEAKAQAERRSGLCFACWNRTTRDDALSPWNTSESAARGDDVATTPVPPQGPVLVVDDDIDIREALVEALQDHGYAVFGAANGAEALALLRSRDAPRLILLDLMMPLMDGYRFRAQQRKDPALADIPVIVITAGTSVRNAELDAVAVFRKPLDLPVLLTTIEQHCN